MCNERENTARVSKLAAKSGVRCVLLTLSSGPTVSKTGSIYLLWVSSSTYSYVCMTAGKENIGKFITVQIGWRKMGPVVDIYIYICVYVYEMNA